MGAADVVVGIEARGFLLGAAAALVAGTGVVPVRKAGKLPRVAASRTYDLEYGTATLELPADTIAAGARVFVVDDVLATGGTAAATCELLADVGRRGGRASACCWSSSRSVDAIGWTRCPCTRCSPSDPRV